REKRPTGPADARAPRERVVRRGASLSPPPEGPPGLVRGPTCSPGPRLRRHLALQPGLGKRPVPDHGLGGHFEDGSRFLGTEPAEEAEFDHAPLPWIPSGQ